MTGSRKLFLFDAAKAGGVLAIVGGIIGGWLGIFTGAAVGVALVYLVGWLNRDIAESLLPAPRRGDYRRREPSASKAVNQAVNQGDTK